MSEDNICVICEGTKSFLGQTCTYCNGTGEWNQPAESYLKDHICQCIIWGRKFCPICKKICHHDSSCTPKQKIDPGYGGMTETRPIQTNQNFTVTSTVEEEQLIMA